MDPETLVEHPLLFGESPAAIEWLFDTMTERWLQAGDVLLEPGEENHLLFLITDGSVRVELEVEGKEVITNLNAGDCVGELSVLDKKSAAAYVVANEATTLLAIERKDIWRLIDLSHIFARNLLNTLSDRVRNDNVSLGESLLLQRRCEKNSKIDFLTGLYNRRWLDQMLPRLIERSQTDGTPLGVMMLDLDHFKRYNDSHGHQAGDEALRVTAATISDHIRPGDSAIRYGGEEFLVILPGSNRKDALMIAERICREIRQHTIIDQFDDTTLPGITTSIGVACLAKGEQVNELIVLADRALYQAKNSGRDRVFIDEVNG
ncbi:MAG: GGDEF domain-containing protein [Chromatiales bacterium]|nr:GGDEF domain-containing protein [Chromatiales bacterium]